MAGFAPSVANNVLTDLHIVFTIITLIMYSVYMLKMDFYQQEVGDPILCRVLTPRGDYSD